MKNMLMLMILATGNTSLMPAYKQRPAETYSRTRDWATHTIIDLYKCSYFTLRSTRDLDAFMHRVCSFIGVTPLGNASVIYHQSGYGYTSGYTMMQHANGHTDIVVRVNEENDTVFIDICSCKTYNPHQLVNLAQDYFGAYEASVDILHRQ